jgi:Thioredoxin
MKTLKRLGILFAVLLALGAVGYALNPPPKAPTIALDDTSAKRPWVIKFHAQWCPVCLFTKGTWSKIESTYGSRVNLVVFDLANKATTEASRAEAKRLGLESVFEAHSHAVGSIHVLDAESKEVRDSIYGRSQFSDCAEAIDEALAAK